MLDGKNWKKRLGASQKVLIDLASIAPAPLSDSYPNFLANSNGGDGPLIVQPYWLMLYPAVEVMEIETDGTFHEFFPGYFVIGSNGAGEAIAFDLREGMAGAIIYFDMTNIDLAESVQPLAKSFSELLELIELHI